jgi:2',3'-cyclic-nucleotide 2'-phosphodiesterase (5'-nucleotidase family)
LERKRFLFTTIFLLSLASVTALLALSPALAASSTSYTLTLMYSGNRRSEIEACGCHNKPLGGIDREATLLNNARKALHPVVAIDSGGFIDTFLSDNERLKSQYLLKALALMDLDAVNVAFTDIPYGLNELKAAGQKVPFISANIVERGTSQTVFRPYRLVEKTLARGSEKVTVGIIGVTRSRAPMQMKPSVPRSFRPAVRRPAPTPRAPQDEFNIPPRTKENLRFGPSGQKTPAPQKQPAGALGVALPRYMLEGKETPYRAPTPPPKESKPQSHLFKDPVKNTLRNAEVGEDELILGRTTSLGGGADPQEKDFADENRVLRPTTPQQSEPPDTAKTDILDPIAALKRIVPELRKRCDIVIVSAYVDSNDAATIAMQVPGIDFLIAGAMRSMQAQPQKAGQTLVVTPGADGKYVGRVILTLNAEKKIIGAVGKQLEIETKVAADARLAPLIAEYKKEMDKQRKEAQARLATAAPRVIFAGATSCKSCHEAQYTQWEKTAHARALQSLVNKKEESDPACVKCHVTGYLDANGFRTMSETPLMANVQCEECHGPAHRHTIEERLRAQRAAYVTIVKNPQQEAPRRFLPPKQIPAGRCVTCHDAENDADFTFEQDLKLISHKSPEGG